MNLNENSINVLVIEHPETLRGIIEELINQLDGHEGQFVLSIDGKPISMLKVFDFIPIPFSIDLNSKKIQSKIYQVLKSEANENLIYEANELNKSFLVFLNQLINRLHYNLTTDLEIDIVALFKSYNVGFRTEELSFLEKLMEYAQISSDLLGLRALIILNLKSYLSETELKEFYKFVFYSKINLILLENSQRDLLEEESMIVVDKDRCIIEIER